MYSITAVLCTDVPFCFQMKFRSKTAATSNKKGTKTKLFW